MTQKCADALFDALESAVAMKDINSNVAEEDATQHYAVAKAAIMEGLTAQQFPPRAAMPDACFKVLLEHFERCTEDRFTSEADQDSLTEYADEARQAVVTAFTGGR